MKILIINYEYPPLGGGGGIFTRDLAEELAKTNDIDVITTHMKGLKQYENINGVNITRIPVFGRTSQYTSSLPALLTFVPSCVSKGIQMIRKKKYDLIHTHFAVPSGPAGIFLSKKFNIPHILSIHGGDIYDPSKKTSPHRHLLLRYLIKKILDNSTKVIAQSQNTKNNASRIYNPSGKIDVIPLGLPIPKFLPAKKDDLGLKMNNKYIISIGRLVKRKGYDHLLRAFSIIKKDICDIGLIIIGNGPEHDNLKKLAEELDVENNVFIINSADDNEKFQYLASSDIYALSSLHEGFGIVLLEAMSQGLPIVAANNGGQTDIIKEPRNGILVPPADNAIFANAIMKILKNEKLCETISKNNREDVSRFIISNIAKKYSDFFKTTLSENNNN